jgi:hypothetical protein
MQIVIDMPEKTVNEIKDNAMFAGSISSEIRWDVTSAIVNGTPLPKGHGKLIDADEEIKNFCNKVCGHTLEECGYGFYCPLVRRMKSAQVVIEADKEQEDNGFFDEIMDDSEDGEVYEKIKEIIAKAKEQEE